MSSEVFMVVTSYKIYNTTQNCKQVIGMGGRNVAWQGRIIWIGTKKIQLIVKIMVYNNNNFNLFFGYYSAFSSFFFVFISSFPFLFSTRWVYSDLESVFEVF